MKRISYLGPEGTYTEQATKCLTERLDEETEITDLISSEAVARSVASGEYDMGVVPYYNYLEGLVQSSLDQIYENGLKIRGLERLPIVLSIGECNGNKSGRIYSHPKALAQCSQWLWENYQNCEQIPTTSTAEAAQKVSENEEGMAIANRDTLEENGLKILAEDIGKKKNGRTNFTDFYLVGRENGVDYDENKSYLTMLAITPHYDEEGLLAQILQQVAYHDLNNAKIHSRPAPDGVIIDGMESQMFYLEVMSHQDEEKLQRCVNSLRYKLTPSNRDVETVRVMGSYEIPEMDQ